MSDMGPDLHNINKKLYVARVPLLRESRVKCNKSDGRRCGPLTYGYMYGQSSLEARGRCSSCETGALVWCWTTWSAT